MANKEYEDLEHAVKSVKGLIYHDYTLKLWQKEAQNIKLKLQLKQVELLYTITGQLDDITFNQEK